MKLFQIDEMLRRMDLEQRKYEPDPMAVHELCEALKGILESLRPMHTIVSMLAEYEGTYEQANDVIDNLTIVLVVIKLSITKISRASIV